MNRSRGKGINAINKKAHGFFTRKQFWVAPAGVLQVDPCDLKASAACRGGRPWCFPRSLAGLSSRASRRLLQDVGSFVSGAALVVRVGVVSCLCLMRRAAQRVRSGRDVYGR